LCAIVRTSPPHIEFSGSDLNRSRRGVPLDPIKALFWSVAAVPIMVMIMLLGPRQKVMRQFTLSSWLKSLGWLATAVMAAAAVGMFATWGD
jgi:Mn2+/Fe2+ NRAMP family transporter